MRYPISAIKFSPDGKSLAFVRNDKELRVVDLDSKQDHVVASGFIQPGDTPGRPTINGSLTSRADDRGLRNIYVVGVGRRRRRTR